MRRRLIYFLILGFPIAAVGMDQKPPERMQDHLKWARQAENLNERVKRLEGFWERYLPSEEGGVHPEMRGYGDGSHFLAIAGCAWDLARAYTSADEKTVQAIADLFAGSTHIKSVALKEADDRVLWDLAKKHGFTIVSKDTDFYQRAIMFGHPPKFIWLRVGNCPTSLITDLLRSRYKIIRQFIASDVESLLVLERKKPNKITGANSRPALQFESRGLRRRALVVESRGRYHGGAAVAQFCRSANRR